MLSMRSRTLLKKLLITQSSFRIKELAKEFDVSERTIKYDLRHIRVWLGEHDLKLNSNPNLGIWIECKESVCAALLKMLDQDQGSILLNPYERGNHLTVDLLLQRSYVTIGTYTRKYDVSRSTILSDLALIEGQFIDNGLELHRSGQGIRVLGSEGRKRHVLENTVLGMLDGNDMMQIVLGVMRRKQPQALSPLLERFLQPVEDLDHVFAATSKIVMEIERTTDMMLSDSMIIGVFVRICIVIQRQHSSEESQQDTWQPPVLSNGKAAIYYIFEHTLGELSKTLAIRFLTHDIWFVSLQAISSISMQPGSSLRLTVMPDAYVVTSEIIRAVNNELDEDIHHDVELFRNLLSHMSRTLSKYSHGVMEPNPILHDIVSAYRDMFGRVKCACDKVLRKYDVDLNDSDVAYIALHFQTAYERQLDMQQFRVLLVCGTGRGTSEYLKTVLSNQIKSLSVVACCSILELTKVLHSISVDLIISIFPLDADIPSVTVHSIPTQQDFQTILEALNEIKQQRDYSTRGLMGPPMNFAQKDILRTEQMIQSVIMRGSELNTDIKQQFNGRLTESRLEGLMLHVLLMMSRVAMDTQYSNFKSSFALEEEIGQIRAEVESLLERHQVKLTEGEMQAILQYFLPH